MRPSFHASLAFLLGLLLCCNVESDPVVIRRLSTGQRRRGGVAGRWTANARRRPSSPRSEFATLYSKRLAPICEEVECPAVEEEQRAGPGITLRRYQTSDWVAYGNAHWKFKNIATIDYKEHFMVRILMGSSCPTCSHPNPITPDSLIITAPSSQCLRHRATSTRTDACNQPPLIADERRG